LFFFGKRSHDRDRYWEEGFLGQGEWNNHKHHRKEEVPESGENHLMFKEYGLEVLWHKMCLSFLYGMELGNNTRMTFFEQLFHVNGTNDLRGTDDDDLELILLALLVELHG
jgi:hypothetical protein